ncbi:MAG: septum formation initiator family protein [Comamonadaceae bacterium]|jgi:cell division protein FtsB|nr:septum formation initiator family protein [Comamonadaceae bacterium]
MSKRVITGILLSLLLILQAQLWFGRGSLPNVRQMQGKLEELSAQNRAAQVENDRLAAEVRDLKEGLGMVEEKARSELGMVKPNEIFIQYSNK